MQRVDSFMPSCSAICSIVSIISCNVLQINVRLRVSSKLMSFADRRRRLGAAWVLEEKLQRSSSLEIAFFNFFFS